MAKKERGRSAKFHSMTIEIDLATADGDIGIRENDLPLTNAELKRFGISRADFDAAFAKARELMRDVKPGERLRPCVEQRLDGSWAVNLVRYSPTTDPAMQVPPKGRA